MHDAVLRTPTPRQRLVADADGSVRAPPHPAHHVAPMSITAPSPYDTGLDRNAANHAPLTPLTLIDWAATACPERTSVIHGVRRFRWRETYARCRRKNTTQQKLNFISLLLNF